MNQYSKQIEIRWSDVDANFHLRHSVYYDLGAFVRISFLAEHGLTTALMQEMNIGPVLFREECIFKREIHFNDKVSINVQLLKCTHDMRKWTMIHQITKNGDTLSALLTVEGAWMDTQARKLTFPPDSFIKVFELIPRAENFEWM